MAIEVVWDDHPDLAPQSTIRYTFRGEWSWDEFSSARATWQQMADESSAAQVATIVDLRESEHYPSQAMVNFGRVLGGLHPKTGPMAVVGMNWIFRVIKDGLALLFPSKLRHIYMVDTLDEAYALLLDLKADE